MSSEYLFHVNPSAGVALYRQIMEQTLRHVAMGRLKPGDFLPSTRQIAERLQINPMTVSKAYSLLERDGVVELVRGQGMRILAPPAGDDRPSLRDRQGELLPQVRQLMAQAHQLSLTADHVKRLVDRAAREREREPAES